MKRLHDKIREILESTPGLTQKELARRMGLNPAAVNRMLCGRRNIMAEEIPVIEAYLGVSLQDDLRTTHAERRGFGEARAPFEMAPPPPVPVYGNAQDRNAVLDWAPRHPAQFGIDGAFALYASSDAMAPRYFRGELVYIHPHRPAEPGRDCVLAMAGGETRLAHLIARTDKTLRVAEFNPARETDIPRAEVEAVYAVVGRG